jgi:hypothetical protein
VTQNKPERAQHEILVNSKNISVKRGTQMDDKNLDNFKDIEKIGLFIRGY